MGQAQVTASDPQKMIVIAGLVPAIHGTTGFRVDDRSLLLESERTDARPCRGWVDRRAKPGDDEGVGLEI